MKTGHELQVSVFLCFVAVRLSAISNSSCTCPPGYSLKLPCSKNSTSNCVECKTGSFKDAFGDGKCQECRSCSWGQIEIAQCTSYRDRQCACPNGTLLSRRVLQCLDCTECPIGSGVTSLCNDKNDTWCEICPKGFTSPTSSATEICKKVSEHVVVKRASRLHYLWLLSLPLVLATVLFGCRYHRRRRLAKQGEPIDSQQLSKITYASQIQ